ncbi:hypothetical protein [Weissella cibaria]|uniref:Uncharacterized protein n=1 Tax=Weissella cibaria TaxID=137591 RepID=A0A0D1LQM3_9LACO|nr:hypothetical protein [Weissella cibaria]KIU20842.1 hypothetical protein ff3pr_02117 [Weissella cibaria]KIU20901.1 hypothetical protein QX99_00967 [Weissella cibaria]MDV8930749.1 hypothetical protein [Weissella cibaria]
MDRITNDRFMILEEQVEELKNHVESQDDKWVEVVNKQNELIHDLMTIVKENEEKYINLLEDGFTEITENVDEQLDKLKLMETTEFIPTTSTVTVNAGSEDTEMVNSEGLLTTVSTHSDTYTVSEDEGYEIKTSTGPNGLKVVTQTKRREYQKVIIDNFVGKIIETDEDDAWIAFKLDVTVPSDYEKGAIDLRVYYQGIDSDGFEIQFGFMNGKVTRGARRTLTSKDMFSRKDLKRIVAWKISD